MLATESARLEDMARSFSQFGRLPEGPVADVDVGELARYVAKATIPPHIPISVDIDAATPLIRGHYDALVRALTNVLLNAVDACAGGGTIALRVEPATTTNPNGTGANGSVAAVRIVVRDTGSGIEASHLRAHLGAVRHPQGRGHGPWHGDRPSDDRGARRIGRCLERAGRRHGSAVHSSRGRRGAAPSPPSHQRPDDGSLMPSVLIIDDEPNIRRMLAALLSGDGYEVRDAPDGEPDWRPRATARPTSCCSIS